MLLSRRNFVRTIVAAAAMEMAPASSEKLRAIGLQLYTVRDLLNSDFEGTLKKVALLGYREVEFAGILGVSIRRTSELLRRLGLSTPSLHFDYTSLLKDTGASFDKAKLLGARFVVCPWLDPSERQTIEDWMRVCENLNALGELAKRSGLTLAYHNHEFEFANLVDGIRPIDLLFSRTDERLVKFALDVYWVKKGNVDPATFLRAHPSRFRLVHLKDMAKDGSTAEIGSGTIDFGEIIDASFHSGVQHYFVEQDHSTDPMGSIATSIAYLRHRI